MTTSLPYREFSLKEFIISPMSILLVKIYSQDKLSRVVRAPQPVIRSILLAKPNI